MVVPWNFILINSEIETVYTKNNSTGPHKPMNIIRNSLLAKITMGISSGFGHMVAIITRICWVFCGRR